MAGERTSRVYWGCRLLKLRIYTAMSGHGHPKYLEATARYKTRHPRLHVETIAVQEIAEEVKKVRVTS
jgi:hypothetical protein